jgi:aminotransferase
MRERTIVISGFSKTFSITGWRIGYVTADARWMPTMAHFHDLTYVCAPAPLQVGAAAGLEQLPPSFYTQLAADHQSKRGRLLARAEGRWHGAIGATGRLLHHGQRRALPGKTAAEKARHLLRSTGVAAVAGSAFFRKGRGENLLRFCFAKQDAELDEACERLRKL